MPLLGYSAWHNFEAAIQRAITACDASSVPPSHHFYDTIKMVAIGSGAERHAGDWYLSRYACYLLAMNADSSKREVSYAQTYFAIQTRLQEHFDALAGDNARLQLRLRVSEHINKLNKTAKRSGVKRFDVFHDAGYKGLYNRSLSDLKQHKGLKPSDNLLDHAGALELTANDFKNMLAEHRLRDKVYAEDVAIQTHQTVGGEVRGLIVRDNGVAPENLPVQCSIKPLVDKHRRQLKAAARKAIANGETE